MSHRVRLLICSLLLAITTCSKVNPTKTEYAINTTCAGGGGRHECVAKNVGRERVGPFDIEIEAVDDRGFSIGRSSVRNDQSLEPGDEWKFQFLSPPSTRSVRVVRVVPR